MKKVKSAKKGPFVFVVEGEYESDRHGNKYWGPILHPREERYAIFAEKEEAEDCITFINDQDCSFDVGIMGNDFLVGFRVTKQSVA